MAAPALLAVDDPLLTLSHGSAPNVGQVGAGAWLGQSGGADPPATSTPLEQLGTPLRALHLGSHAVAPGDDAGDTHPGARQLLTDQAVLEDAKAKAAELFRDRDPEVAAVGHPVQEPVGDVGLLPVQLIGER